MTSQAVHVGQAEVEQDEVGPARLPALEGRPAVGRLLNADSRGPELADQRRAGLVVVLDDQDGRLGASLGRVTTLPGPAGDGRTAAAGRSRSIASPPSSLARAPTRPPIASTRPRTTASPIPVPDREPPGRAGHPVELVEQPSEASRPGRPARRPRRSGGRSRRRRSRGRDPDRRVRGRVYLSAFSTTLVTRLVEEDRVDVDGRRRRASTSSGRSAEAPARAARASGRRGRRARTRRGPPGARRPRSGCRSSRFVTRRLRYSTSRSIAVGALAPARPRSRPTARPERPGRGPDRRQRRSQVVRDRLEQGRLQGVALAGDLGGRRFGGEPVLARAWPSWSAAAASRRVSVRSGSRPSAARERPRSSRYGSSPASIRTRKTSNPDGRRAPAAPGCGRDPSWPARRPAVRWRTRWRRGQPVVAGPRGVGRDAPRPARRVRARPRRGSMLAPSRRIAAIVGQHRRRRRPRRERTAHPEQRLAPRAPARSPQSPREALEGGELADHDPDEQQQHEVERARPAGRR